MHSNVQRLYVPEYSFVARTLLAELRDAHRALIAQMAAMDSLTERPDVDVTQCATARWRLSQASLQRRLLAARICDYFVPRFEGELREELKSLIYADQALLRESSAYLGRWSTVTLRTDWPGFCDASREMRRKTHAHITREQKLLYPMLEEAAKRAA